MKILANRLKDILPEIVSDFQSAFVLGRLISDNILLAHEVLHYIKSRKNQKVGFFSIKMDMSKAYDRMEWRFLELMLIKLGFPIPWTRLVMECIRSVGYKVKVNNMVIEIPPPQRGLRQGDPLSPYLFLLCAEWLSLKISREVHSQRLKGVKVCHGAPVISHLFFADDCIFFMKATLQNAGRLKAVMERYESISGQRINLAKSEIVFSRNVAEAVKSRIVDTFRVQVVGAHSKYLGLPITFSHNKTEVFKNIVDSTWKRVMGWRETHLSAAGKEIMVKSVLQALPTYAMMCFKLPVSLCKRLFGIIGRFWWAPDGDSKGVHWANQMKLTYPKTEGGLNFRDLAIFNDALLGKQYWRLLQKPDTIIARTLKAKYFRNSSLIDSHLSEPCSLAWRGIWRAGVRVKNWIRWDVTTGNPVWELEADGNYSTKSAYKKLKELQMQMIRTEQGESSDRSKQEAFWKKVWRLKVQRKVKVFIWRVFHDYLPSAVNLLKRGCQTDPRCSVCGYEIETTTHIFLDCWWARAFWNKLNIEGFILEMHQGSITDWIWHNFSTMSMEKLILLCYGARLIWYNRNLCSHGKQGLDLEAAYLSTKAIASRYNKPDYKFSISDFEGNSGWIAPEHPYVKINCDGAWEDVRGVSGSSCVCRDGEGAVLAVLAEPIMNIHSPFEAEGVAILKAMQWADEQNLPHCIFETDCAEAFSTISLRRLRLSQLPEWARDCITLLNSKEHWRLALCHREANRVADALARFVKERNWSWRSTNALPRVPEAFLSCSRAESRVVVV
ncbi:unnamed protein product [Rhodiola kirilowii]